MNSPHQKRHLSQVFLKTTVPCEQLASVLVEKHVNSVVEIGPGKGILTRVLLDQGFKVTCVEKDHRFVKYLEENFAEDISQKKLSLCNEDALEFDFDAWRSHSDGKLAICGNIPYNISTPLLERMLPQLPHIEVAALLVQLEFGERIVSAPSSKSYGSLSVFTQLRADVRLEFIVDRSCFVPVPKVDSAIISFKPKLSQESPLLLKKVEKLSKLAFSQRRKKLSNALSVLLEGNEDVELPVDLSRRPDTISPLEYLELAKRLQLNSFFDEKTPREPLKKSKEYKKT